MGKRQILIGAVLLAMAAFSVPAGGGKEPSPEGEVHLEGRVVLTGSAPHPQLILKTGDQRQYRLVGEKAQQLREEGRSRTIRIRGILLDADRQNSLEPPRIQLLSWEATGEEPPVVPPARQDRSP